MRIEPASAAVLGDDHRSWALVSTSQRRATLAAIVSVLCSPMTTAQADAAETAAETQSDASAGSFSLEEVIVTAQKREERLKDVPISISVLSGQELDQSTEQNVGRALARVPGVA